MAPDAGTVTVELLESIVVSDGFVPDAVAMLVTEPVVHIGLGHRVAAGTGLRRTWCE